MAENSGISWTDHTFNPWLGCVKVAAGCTNCYAELLMDTRYHKVQWGADGTRVLTSPANWAKPLKWDGWARDGVCPVCGGRGTVKLPSGAKPCCERCGGWGSGNVEPYRAKVFCASLADVFEEWGTKQVMTHQGHVAVTDTGATMCLDDVRDRLFALIDSTPHLDWLLLTKRPENVRRMWPAVTIGSQQQADDRNERGELYRSNIWLGCSVAEQKDVERNVPLLLKCNDRSPLLWLSAEPMLGRLDFSKVVFPQDGCPGCGGSGTTLGPFAESEVACDHRFSDAARVVGWVIAGVESNGNAAGRLGEFANETEWCAAAEDLGRQCVAAGVSYFVKQIPLAGRCSHVPAEWPESLRIQEFPRVDVSV